MVKILRILAAFLVGGLLLYAANSATKDCSSGLYVWDNCLWMSVRDYLGLPSSRFFRAVVLEVAGLALLAGLYLDVRYVLGYKRLQTSVEDSFPNRITSPEGR